MICFPNAKINLGLSVTQKRFDGMHNIETCFVPIPLTDVLEVKPASNFNVAEFGKPIPGGEKIISKTWDILQSRHKNLLPVEVCLYKNIPMGSGLGGGSSDGAFFIKMVNVINKLNLSDKEMQEIAAEVGADCSFFIKNNITLATGVGNVFKPIANIVSKMHILVLFPGIEISTKGAFDKITPNVNSNIENVLLDSNIYWKKNLVNIFEETVAEYFPELPSVKKLLYDIGALYVSVTGSGSALYALSYGKLPVKKISNNYIIWQGVL